MNSKYRNIRILSTLFLAVVMLTTTVFNSCFFGKALAEGQENDSLNCENAFDAYYSQDLKKADPTVVKLEDQWSFSSDRKRLSRKGVGEDQWNSNTTKNVSLLYFNAQEFTNFEMETTISHATNGDNLVCFFGFGAKKGVSWVNNAGDTALSINPTHGAIIDAKNENWISTAENRLAAQDSDYSMNAIHTLKIRMFEKKYTVWLDGYQVATGTNSSYTGGYIYFGANARATSFGVPKVKELFNTDDFSAYFSEDLGEYEMVSKASLSTQWSLSTDGERMKRNLAFAGDEKYNSWGSDMTKNMSILYYNVKQYNDFEMKFDYKQSVDESNVICFFGCGAQMGKSWIYNNSDIAFAINPKGYLQNARTSLAETPAQNSASVQNSGFDIQGIHTLTFRMAGGKFTVWIDGMLIGEGTAENYNGGYIYFAANAGTAEFSAPQISELFEDASVDPYYTDSISSGTLEKEDLTAHWTKSEDGAYITRNPESGVSVTDAESNVALLYDNSDQYTNFDFSVNYKSAAADDEYVLFAGFGAEKGISRTANAAETSFIITGEGKALNANTNFAFSELSASKQAQAAGVSWKSSDVHSLTLSVKDKQYTLSVDGYIVATGRSEAYKGGYIYIGANASEVSFYSLCTVTNDEKHDPLNLESFKVYHTDSVKSGMFTEEVYSEHWTLSEDKSMLIHSAATKSWNMDTDSDMSILYYNVDEYEDFNMSVRFATNGVYDDWITFFGFGAEIGKSWAENSGDTAFGIHAGGLVFNAKAKNTDGVWLNPQTAASTQAAREGKTWNAKGIHTLNVTVSDGSYTIKIDGYKLYSGKNSNYKGGYIWFAANGAASFGEPTVGRMLDENIFDFYYTSNVNTEAPVKEEYSAHWTKSEDGMRVLRKNSVKTWNQDIASDMAILIYNAASYTNFDMTVDYTTNGNYDDWITFFGFGAEEGTSWMNNDGDTAFVMHAGGLLLNAKGTNAWLPGTSAQHQTGLSGETWDPKAVHKLRIRVIGGNYTVFIDGYKISTGKNEQYNGGYIWFAANGAASFGEPVVQEIIEPDMFTAFHTDNIKTSAPIQTKLSDKWTVTEDGMSLERSSGSSKYGADLYENLDILYYNVSKYQNFDMTVTYKTVGTYDDWTAFVGFGAESLGDSWIGSNNQVGLMLHGSGLLVNAINGQWIDGTAGVHQAHDDGKYWGSRHTLRIKVEDCYYQVFVDGYQIGDGANWYYNGGYIWFAASADKVTFGIPEVTELDGEYEYIDPDDVDPGWQPTESDSQFDFNLVKFIREKLFEYTPIRVKEK